VLVDKTDDEISLKQDKYVFCRDCESTTGRHIFDQRDVLVREVKGFVVPMREQNIAAR